MDLLMQTRKTHPRSANIFKVALIDERFINKIFLIPLLMYAGIMLEFTKQMYALRNLLHVERTFSYLT